MLPFQYINVLIGISVVYIIYRILHLLDINKNIQKTIIFIAAFFPNSLIMSAIFLREIFPTFFVALSLYYFIKWMKVSGYKNIIVSFVLLGFASLFHSGVIGIALGYSFTFLFYKRKYNTFRFSTNTVASFLIIIIIFSLAFTVFEKDIFIKFQSIEGIEDIYQRASKSGEGGSGYLKSISINNPLQLAVFGPVRSFYFISSPLPMYWRGFMDIFTFMTDSILYLGTLIYFLKNKDKLGNRKALAISLFMMIIGSTFIFGIGVSNAGTAVRHRQKLVPLFLILLGVLIDGKRLSSKNISLN